MQGRGVCDSQPWAREGGAHPQSSWGSLGPPPEAYSAAICSMWSLSSLYCSGRENNVIPRERDGDTDRQVLLIRGDNKAGPLGHGECGLLKVCPRPGSGLLGTGMHLPMAMTLHRAAPQAPRKPGVGR